jgi:predicted lipoprotein with Yx(FWY)xxD motif
MSSEREVAVRTAGHSSHTPTRSASRRARGATCAAAALGALALSALLASLALAASTVTIGSASSSALGARVAVSSQGRTLYVLTPETSHHLLCTSPECLRFWPPVTVPSRSAHLKDGAGLHGHLAVLRRSNGVLQVTLNGMPLYRFAGDHGKAEDNGQGIETFGGTWHALLASGKASTGGKAASPVAPAPAPSPAPAPAPMPPPPPSYPGYQY